MPPEESRYPEDWFRIGDKELKRARLLLKEGDLDGAGFNLQQALEKYLKGFLLGKGWTLRRIHDLETLLNDAIRFDPSLEQFRAPCRKISQYYIEDRYPFTVSSELKEEELRESLAFTETLVAQIRSS
jgi:HEPN domain-containing protein